ARFARSPTANVTTHSSGSRYASWVSNDPGSAAARSRATEGFSAMTRVLDIRDTLAKRRHAAARRIAFSYISVAMAAPFYVFLGAISVPIVRGLYRLRVEGLEHLPRHGGYVLAAHPTSKLDP